MWQKGIVRLKNGNCIDVWAEAAPPQSRTGIGSRSRTACTCVGYVVAIGHRYSPDAAVIMPADRIELLPEFQEDVEKEPLHEWEKRLEEARKQTHDLHS